MFKDANKKPKFSISAENEGDFAFLLRIRKQINQDYDLLCINSIQGYRIGYFYLLRFKVPTIAAAGRISEFFGSNYKILGLNSIRRIAHHNYTRFLLPKVIKSLKGLIVHTKKAKQLALAEGYRNPIHCMPFSLHIKQKKIIKNPQNSVHFLITGSITERSRDYFSVLSLFESIWEKGIKGAKLTVLSSPKTNYGYKVYDEMQRLKNKGYPIKCFSDWIPEQQFVSETAKADFLIAPILQGYYGAGEITSVQVESIRMGIPAFYPDWYSVDENQKDSSIFYTSHDHLKELIIRYATNLSKVGYMKTMAQNNAKELCLENVSKQLSEFLIQNIFIETNANTCSEE